MANDLLQRPDEDQDHANQTPDVNELEDLYQRDAIPDNKRNVDTPAPGADKLEDAYNQPARQDQDRNTSEPDETESMLNRLPSGGGTRLEKVTGFFRKNKKPAIGTGVAGGVISLVFALFSITSGPLQVIHYSQILQGINMLLPNEVFDDRLNSIRKFARHPTNPELRRINKLQQRVASNAEAKYRASGFEPVYEGASGRLTGFDIDPDSPAANQIDNYRSRGLEIDPNGGDGGRPRILIDPAGTSIRAAKANYRTFRTAAAPSLDTKIGAIASRQLTAKAGLRFSNILTPSRGFDSVRAKLDSWRQRKTDYVERGSYDTPGRVDTNERVTDVDPDADGNQPRTNTSSTDLSGSKAALKATKGIAGVALVCMAWNIAESAEDTRVLNLIQPSMRIGWDIIGGGAQAQSGIKTDLDILGELSSDFYDEEAETSFADAASIQRAMGEPVTGPEIVASAHPTESGTFVTDLFQSIPGVGATAISSVCSVATSWAAEAVDITLTFLTLGLKTVIVDGVTALLAGTFADDLVRLAVGDTIPEVLKGAAKGNVAFAGTLYAGNEQMLAAGGLRMTDQQVGTLTARAEAQKLAERKQLAFTDRLFDYYDVDSLLAKLSLRSLNPRSTSGRSSMLALITNPLQSIRNATNSPTAVYAIGGTDEETLGVGRFGFDAETLDSERYDNSYENIERGIELLNESDDLREYLDTCFGVRYNQEDGTSDVIPGEVRILNPDRPDSCEDRTQQRDDVRMYLLDFTALRSDACDAGDDQACKALGFASSSGVSDNSQPDPINGIESPSNLGEANSEGYYQMPSAPNGEYALNTNGGSPRDSQCGSKTLVDVTYTILKKYNEEYSDTLGVGDLNAPGHASHDRGVDVDIYAAPYNANTMTSDERAIQLGKWAHDTGAVEIIGYENQAVVDAVNEYAGDSSFMQVWSGHKDHFHLRINPTYAGQVSTSCAN